MAEAGRELGRVDVMVNNAGIAKAQPFLEITPENWETHLRVHLFGAFYCSQAAAREMAQRKYGRIISIASVAGLMGPFDLAPYMGRESRNHRAVTRDGSGASGLVVDSWLIVPSEAGSRSSRCVGDLNTSRSPFGFIRRDDRSVGDTHGCG